MNSEKIRLLSKTDFLNSAGIQFSVLIKDTSVSLFKRYEYDAYLFF